MGTREACAPTGSQSDIELIREQVKMGTSKACGHQQVPFPQPLRTAGRNVPCTGWHRGSDAGGSHAPSLAGRVLLCAGGAAFIFTRTTPE